MLTGMPESEISSSNAEIIANMKALPVIMQFFAQASTPLGSMSHWHKDFVTMATGHWTNEIIGCHGNPISILLPPGTCFKSSHPLTTLYHLTVPLFFPLVTLLSLVIYVRALKLTFVFIYETPKWATANESDFFAAWSHTMAREALSKSRAKQPSRCMKCVMTSFPAFP